MDEPLYDVIICNVQGAKEILDLDPIGRSGDEDDAAKILQLDRNILAALKSHVPATPNPTPSLGIEDVTKGVLEREQLKDTSLDICRGRIADTHVTKEGNTYSFYLSEGVLFRRCLLTNGKEFRQVVVPRTLRHHILSLAHDIAMAGHQGIKRTSDRVLESFYWPGVLADVKRFVRSCDLCQRTIPKGMVSNAPLGRMPIIETPFERVSIDLIGPLSPTSKNENQFILTLVDFSTGYPEAVALTSTDSKTVAEGLIEILSRVGLPSEIISDKGTNFTSELMNEVTELLSIKHLLSIPYHSKCNGLVEWDRTFHRTPFRRTPFHRSRFIECRFIERRFIEHRFIEAVSSNAVLSNAVLSNARVAFPLPEAGRRCPSVLEVFDLHRHRTSTDGRKAGGDAEFPRASSPEDGHSGKECEGTPFL
ncbi:uncharacterized protein ISCGN_009439 [Ixodes scapularis]